MDMVSKGRNVILAKMDCEEMSLVVKTLQPVELSHLCCTATAQLDQLKGRKLTDAEKGRKIELEDIIQREKTIQERQQTKEVVYALIEEVEVRFDLIVR